MITCERQDVYVTVYWDSESVQQGVLSIDRDNRYCKTPLLMLGNFGT